MKKYIRKNNRNYRYNILKRSVCLYIHTYKISVTTLETNLIAVDLERGECENHLDRIDM